MTFEKQFSIIFVFEVFRVLVIPLDSAPNGDVILSLYDLHKISSSNEPGRRGRERERAMQLQCLHLCAEKEERERERQRRKIEEAVMGSLESRGFSLPIEYLSSSLCVTSLSFLASVEWNE